MDKDTQLPAEVVQRINEQAATAMQKEQERLQNEYPEMEYGLMLHQIHGFQDGHIMCATEYAIKLYQASALLKNVFTRYGEIHEWDRKIFNDIKTFLDGAK